MRNALSMRNLSSPDTGDSCRVSSQRAGEVIGRDRFWGGMEEGLGMRAYTR